MSEPTKVRFSIDPELHNAFKTHCTRSGVSMAEQTAKMIAEFLDENSSTGDQTNAKPDEPESDPGGEADPPNSIETVIDVIACHHDELLEGLGRLATGKNVNWLLDRIDEAADRRRDRVEKAVTALGKNIDDSVEASHRRWHYLIDQRRRDRYWLGGAAAAGIAALTLMLALISGTGLGRHIAVKLVGANSQWQAALQLAGDGSLLHGTMMAETKALLDNPLYREAYATCVDRAKKARRAITCKLAMPGLVREE